MNVNVSKHGPIAKNVLNAGLIRVGDGLYLSRSNDADNLGTKTKKIIG